VSFFAPSTEYAVFFTTKDTKGTKKNAGLPLLLWSSHQHVRVTDVRISKAQKCKWRRIYELSGRFPGIGFIIHQRQHFYRCIFAEIELFQVNPESVGCKSHSFSQSDLCDPENDPENTIGNIAI
jgi:hypothetical protein